MPDANGPARAWDGILKVAGAVAGLAVLLYFVGAVTLWARFKAAGLPADKAVEHQPRGALIAVGVRGVVVVIAVLLLLLVAAYVALAVYGWIKPRVGPTSSAQTPESSSPLEIATETVDRTGEGVMRLLGVGSIAVLLVASAISWHALAVAIVVVASLAIFVAYVRGRSPDRSGLPLWMIVVAALAVGVAGVCWQVDPPVLVQTVVVTPPPCTPAERGRAETTCAELTDVALPYLGETDAYVFVAEIRHVEKDEGGRFKWKYTHNILEIPRGEVELIFIEERGELAPSVPTPLRTFRTSLQTLL